MSLRFLTPVSDDNFCLSAIVLAAGASTRMGRPKELLRFDGKALWQICVEKFLKAGVSDVVVVTRSFHEDLKKGIKSLGARIVLNKDADSHMMDSVILGMESLSPSSTGCMILPVDCGLVKEETIIQLVGLHVTRPDFLIRPFSKKRGGHPLLVPRFLYKEICSGKAESLRLIMKRYSKRLINMPCSDGWAFFDIDTPKDFLFAKKALGIRRVS